MTTTEAPDPRTTTPGVTGADALKVLIVHQYARVPRTPGGTRHYLLARELARHGHDVTVVASRYDFKTDDVIHPAPVETLDGAEFHWIDAGREGAGLGARLKGMLGFSRAAARYAQSLDRDFDIVISTSPHPFQALFAERFATRRGIPFALEIRDLWPLTMRDLSGWKPWHPGWILLRAIEKHLYRRAAWIVTLLPGAEEWIAGSGGDPHRISVIPNGVDGRLVPSIVDYPDDDGRFEVMYAGSLGAANALETVVRAGRLVMDRAGGEGIHVTLLGDGPEKAHLQDLARRIGADNVSFEDAVPRTEVHKRISRAHAAVIHLKDAPTFRFGVSPNKLFDYLLAARPTLYCIRSSNDPVGEARAGLVVPPEDADALADAMIALAHRPRDERIAMGRRGRSFVLQHHEWTMLGARFADTIGQAVKLHEARASKRP